MASTLLTIGPVHLLVQNQSYATPTRRTMMYSDSAATMQGSTDETAWVALTLVNNQVEVAFPFVRSTAAGTRVSFKAS